MPAYQLSCEDAGHDDCAFMVRSEDRDEVIDLAREHAKSAHDETYSRSDVADLLQQTEWQASD